ncbi:carboxymuconolactone decarboxylase family protein [Halarsenatibacter silvermanii]|uniref:Alkylhydroperoxidase AhpD family core domain-containing protein n=1 Tax=Halarsenatibacter silvermanii TaxID=321763 RepID=A0A1G9QV91_9FIRM|nr:carboxymuconolactone decarboxylase family protein [Halarsenatibacter silvermanii]SDM14770.1 alkylhydroperoxidase AhpD family core domain-containing protein [Halarsenatibacter silvermanii]
MPKADELLAELESGHEKLGEEISEEMKDFRDFAENVHSEGALSAKQKSLIALGAAAVKQCKYCIVKNLQEAIERGATRNEIAETCSVIMLLNGGPGSAYSGFIMEKFDELQQSQN